jgi:hypothetical protein
MYTYPHTIENGEGEVLTFSASFAIESAIAWSSNYLLRLMSVRQREMLQALVSADEQAGLDVPHRSARRDLTAARSPLYCPL